MSGVFGQRLARIPRHMLAGAVAALATAALHLAIVTFSRDVLGRFSWSWFARDVVWMVPAGYLTVFAAVSFPLGVVAALLPRGISPRFTAWLWGTLMTFSVLILFPRIHSLAWLVVALALGYQLSRIAAKNPEALVRVTVLGGAALAVGFVALISAFEGRRALVMRRAMDRRPPATANAPNIVLLVWDTARAMSFRLYGYHRETTPFLDSLARKSVVFDLALSTAPWTLPSHAGMLTGQYASAQSGDWNSPIDGAHRTLAEELQTKGYATAAFVSNWLAAGYSAGFHRGFVEYKDTKRTMSEVVLNTTLTQSASLLHAYRVFMRDRWLGGAARSVLRFDFRPYDTYQSHVLKTGAEVTDDFLNWQRGTKSPFFVLLNYSEAHTPNVAPNRDHFAGGATLVDRYDGALWTLDGELRRLTEALRQRGELSRTIIVVTSDHGEQFGEHGLNRHGNSLYLTLLHVPLVIYVPQHPAAGTRFSRVVSLRDLPRTLLDLVGVDSTALPGVALLPRDSAALSTVVPSVAISEVSSGVNDHPRNPTYYGDLMSVVDDSLHVIRDGKGEHHVYAFRRDTAESNDLATDPRVEAWARAHIDSVIRALGLRPPNVRGRTTAGS
jgi:arylsulfatase A-like enzyme